jgi:hypothetical protein
MAETLFEKDLSGTYLFISFDLVNSTAFKIRDPQWPPLFNQFFDYCRIKTKNYFPNCHDWKMVGDEILFYMPVTTESDLVDAPTKIFSIMNSCIKYLDNQATTKGVLSVKSVVWTAYMKEQRHFNADISGRNYLIKSVVGGNFQLDFLGPDIDTGFRIGAFSLGGKLVVGANLAAILNRLANRKNRLAQRVKIISYELLKGVWSGRRYPVAWYHEQWDNPEKMFLYDERFNSELVDSIIREKVAEKDSLSDIAKVFSDLHKEQDLEDVSNGITEQKSKLEEKLETKPVGFERLSEVHLVALCFNENGELLIGERREGDKLIWDFGCSSLQMFQGIEESLEQGYRDDFGVELEKFNDEYPPISTYSYFPDSERRTVPGILFLAKVKKASVTEKSIDKISYKGFKWVNPKSIDLIDEKNGVPGFHDSVQRAFKAYEEKVKR